jgi:thymidylate synthase ThyX
MGYEAKILADSLSPAGVRLTTMQVTFPRIVLAEFNTHRAFSRCSASSRAIPVEKRIKAVQEDPFIPASFGRNRPGMQATEQFEDLERERAMEAWDCARLDAVSHAKSLAALGVHKQLANRVLEPFLWHTVIVSATEWENFFALRCHPDAQPEIRTVAEMMRAEQRSWIPGNVSNGAWHRPLMPDLNELEEAGWNDHDLNLISIGRCARVSYLTHDGKRDPLADRDLAVRIIKAGHMSPSEHVATPCVRESMRFAMVGNFRGWFQFRKTIPSEENFGAVSCHDTATKDG